MLVRAGLSRSIYCCICKMFAQGIELMIRQTFYRFLFSGVVLFLLLHIFSRFFYMTKPLCTYTNFVGRLNVNMAFVPFDQLARKYGTSSEQGTGARGSKSTDIQYTLEYLGGEENHAAQAVWTPMGCYQREVTAIIIPYRNRFYDLSVFINHLTPILRQQRRRYTIFLIEQVKPKTFNRAALLNIGYNVALGTGNYGCFIFHDVDLLPEDDRMIYGCEDHPLHMTALVDKFGYKIFYYDTFGGGVAMTRTQFEKALGYPNTYFGWGAEDDDMSARLKFSNQKLMRRNLTFSRYKMIVHKRNTGNEENPKKDLRLDRAFANWQNDTYRHIEYAVSQRELMYNGLYYHFKVDILRPTLEAARAIT